MKKFIKVMAYILAVPAALFVGGFSYGMYLGFEQVAESDARVAVFEEQMAAMESCGDGDEAAYNANPVCQDICESFFQCRNDYLTMELAVDFELAGLHEDSYTEEEYEAIYGRLDFAENLVDPGTPPNPILD